MLKNNAMPQIWKVIKTLRKNPFEPINELYINQHNKTSVTCADDILQRQKHIAKKTSTQTITSLLLTSNPSLKNPQHQYTTDEQKTLNTLKLNRLSSPLFLFLQKMKILKIP